MPRDWIDIGSSPPDEDCAQLGSDGYYDQAQKECRAYIGLLRRTLGNEPLCARLAIKSNPHDFGTYLSVVCYYNTENVETENYAFRCESEGPDNWDESARQELGRKEEIKP